MFLPEDMNAPIWRLANAMCEGTISDKELLELESLLESDPIARDFYIDFLIVNSEISWLISSRQHSSMDIGPRISADVLENLVKPKNNPVLGFFGHITDFFNHYSPLSFVLLFMSVGAIVLTAAFLMKSRDISKASKEPMFVAQITAVKDCVWSMEAETPSSMESLRVGRKLELEKGVVEITYTNKAQVVIEGPASYTVDSQKSGFLSQGKIVRPG